jgi:hypothetical protein
MTDLERSHKEIQNHKEIQQALSGYLERNNLALTGQERFSWGIDCVGVFVGELLILNIGLPPVSNYPVRETEHTRKYLQVSEPIAV